MRKRVKHFSEKGEKIENREYERKQYDIKALKKERVIKRNKKKEKKPWYLLKYVLEIKFNNILTLCITVGKTLFRSKYLIIKLIVITIWIQT